jgi:hypothetical protein
VKRTVVRNSSSSQECKSNILPRWSSSFRRSNLKLKTALGRLPKAYVGTIKNGWNAHQLTLTGKSSDDTISDVFDSEHYRNLCKTRVTVDGKQLPHNFFSGKHDIAFSTCLDSNRSWGLEVRVGDAWLGRVMLELCTWSYENSKLQVNNLSRVKSLC